MEMRKQLLQREHLSDILTRLPNEHSNKTVSIFILKTIYFILQNMFRSLHTSSSVVQIKSTVNIQIIGVCYNVTVSLKYN